MLPKMAEQIILADFDFRWDEGKVLVRLGSRNGLRSAAPSLLALLKDTESRLPALLAPKAAYTIIRHEETNGNRIFDKAVMVALGVVTIGPALEAEIETAFKEGDMLKGLILDAFGTDAIVQVFKQAERRIVEEALRRGLWPSKRFSPGYRGWPLEEQKFLFQKVDAASIGVRLNDSCMMIPRKSNSFRINFYADRSFTTRRLPPSI
ncbi:MAG: hypothetical protein MUP52_05880 [Candidatus Aminicenantes bacterium]|nr:hypothetical protein [Candidatus Aminicenantes bacterium]